MELEDDDHIDVQELERFVTENDELLELEALIGRFNLFDALRIARAEIRHSNFLAWLLDPAESHGQGQLFLSALLMGILREAPPGLRPFSPVELDGLNLRGVDVRREWKNIDILITCKEPPFAVVIENKIGAGERKGQLNRYASLVASLRIDATPLLVFLTVDGDEASDERFVSYSYADIHEVLTRCLRTYSGAIGEDVRIILDHYLRLIGSRFMNNEKIKELCGRIYRNHRQALDLIFDHVSSASVLIGEIEEYLRKSPNTWHILGVTSKVIRFVPKSWLERLPSIGKRSTFDPHAWLVLELVAGRTKCRFQVSARPTRDSEFRHKTIERLVRDPSEFGLRVFSKKIMSDKFTRLAQDAVATWDEDEEPDPQTVLPLVAKKLEAIEKKFMSIPDVIAALGTPKS